MNIEEQIFEIKKRIERQEAYIDSVKNTIDNSLKDTNENVQNCANSIVDNELTADNYHVKTVDDIISLNINVGHGEWNSSTQYEVDYYCTYNGKLYKCLMPNTGIVPTNAVYWTETDVATELNKLIKISKGE